MRLNWRLCSGVSGAKGPETYSQTWAVTVSIFQTLFSSETVVPNDTCVAPYTSSYVQLIA